MDHHRYDAIRILDFPHAGERLSTVGQAVFGEGSAQAQDWLAAQLHELKHAGPATVLAAVRQCVRQQPEPTTLATHLAYLEKRSDHMQYPAFQAAGWPIGGGAVESGNKLVVEARLKGSSMHRTRAHVDPMLALRNIVCSDRWAEAWPQITQTLRHQTRQHRTQRRAQRRPTPQPVPVLIAQPPSPTETAPLPTAPILVSPVPTPPVPQPISTRATVADPWRPPPDHPWRHMPIGRARFRPPPNAKT